MQSVANDQTPEQVIAGRMEQDLVLRTKREEEARALGREYNQATAKGLAWLKSQGYPNGKLTEGLPGHNEPVATFDYRVFNSQFDSNTYVLASDGIVYIEKICAIEEREERSWEVYLSSEKIWQDVENLYSKSSRIIPGRMDRIVDRKLEYYHLLVDKVVKATTGESAVKKRRWFSRKK